MKRAGFTLIELLIVVAIIAVLAAIAVPNFLEAQTRAKISRNKADMRACATGVETYHIDNNIYPFPADPFGAPIPPPFSVPWFETKVPTSITTPIAYLNSRFADPYHPKEAQEEDPVYHLMARDYARAQSVENQFSAYVGLFGAPKSETKYVMLGHGPDGDHDGPDDSDPQIYDASNGTVSNGDILYFGSGIGFLDGR